MVTKSINGRQILKTNDTNRYNSDISNKFKAKLSKENSPNFKNIPSSPSKIPLTSSSLANINNGSPSKQQILLQRTPQKIYPTTPSKQETLLYKISPPKLKLTPIKQERPQFNQQPPPFDSPSSIETNSPASIKLEEDCPTSPYNSQSLFGSGSINGEPNRSEGSCRKRITTTTTALSSSLDNTRSAPPVSRRNARERNRVKQVSMGFAILRQHVPQGNRKKKLSKVETLRCAVDYIRSLQSLLQDNPITVHTSSSTIQQKTQQVKYHHQSILSEQYMQVPLLHPKHEENFHYNVKKLSPLQHTYQNANSPEIYYEDRVILQQMSNSSCLEPHVLKVPKVENQFQTPSDYLPSLYSYSTTTYSKGSLINGANIPQNSSVEEESPHVNKESLGQHLPHPADLPEYYSYPQKETGETGETDLMEALAWWQQNT